ncbi:MAG: hypothetical protein WDZ49_06095 [Litorilinea sp.]
MLPLTTMTATRTAPNMWLTSIYSGVITAIAGLAFVLLFKAEMPVLYIPAFLLLGAGPVLGYGFATGRLGSDWKSLIGGILGFLLLILGPILWAILVGALDKTQNVGRLLLGSVIGLILGIVVFLSLGSLMGQDPAWFGFGFIMGWAVWGGTAGATMIAWGNPEG